MPYTIRTYSRKTGKIFRGIRMGFATKKEARAVLRYSKSQTPKKLLKIRIGKVVKIR